MKEVIKTKFEAVNSINALSAQIEALTDLMMACDSDMTDIKSIHTASEMVMSFHIDLMVEVAKLEKAFDDLVENSKLSESKSNDKKECVRDILSELYEHRAECRKLGIDMTVGWVLDFLENLEDE